MAFKHGAPTSVWFNRIEMSGYLKSAEMSVDIDTADTTTFGSTWKSAITGLPGYTFSSEGLYDPGVTVMYDNLALDTGALTFCPGGGASIGDRARLMNVTASNYTESAPIDDAVSFSWELMGEDAVDFGFVLHPMGEDTNTTTGAERDDTAGLISATGWTMHLHVTNVDGGSWVIRLQDAAVSNTYTDVSGGAFGAKTTVGYQRLRSATATDPLRRFVRYIATRTGGSAGDGITFALAYARTRESAS